MPTILQRIAAGDESAVAEAVDEYGGLAWRLAQRYIGRAQGEIDDAVQEAFMEVWLSAGRFDPGRGSEPAFVATIFHRRLIDYQRRLRARSREVAFSAINGSDPPPSLAQDASLPDPVEVAGAFDRLPDDERTALWMFVHGGLSHSQIAEATSAPLGTVKTRLRRGLARLYDVLRSATIHARNEEGTLS